MGTNPASIPLENLEGGSTRRTRSDRRRIGGNRGLGGRRRERKGRGRIDIGRRRRGRKGGGDRDEERGDGARREGRRRRGGSPLVPSTLQRGRRGRSRRRRSRRKRASGAGPGVRRRQRANGRNREGGAGLVKPEKTHGASNRVTTVRDHSATHPTGKGRTGIGMDPSPKKKKSQRKDPVQGSSCLMRTGGHKTAQGKGEKGADETPEKPGKIDSHLDPPHPGRGPGHRVEATVFVPADKLLLEVAEIVERVSRSGRELVFVWVAGHCGLAGNEEADGEAGRASGMRQEGSDCLFQSVRALWKRRERVKEWQHERCRKVYESGIREELERELGRKEAVQLARLRSGHSLELLGYRARVGLLEGEGLCRKCGEEGEGLEHVWGCPGGIGSVGSSG